MPVVLASVSPRRSEILAGAGIDFEVVGSPAEELHDAAMAPHVLCETNATAKAVAVAAQRPEATVIGADTLVFIDGEPLGKPRDVAEARQMLSRLSGRTHRVCTGVCVVFPGGRKEVFHEVTEVDFLPFGLETIEEYFSRVNPLDKAGGYGIQEHGELLVAGIRGNFDNVMGLPSAAVVAVLQRPL
jgi:septum formation protein